MENWQNNLRIIRNLLFIKFAILILYILYILSEIFIPLVFAFFLAIVLQPSVSWLRSKNLSLGASVLIISLGFIGLLVLVDFIVYDTVKGLILQKEMFLDRLNTGMATVTARLSELTAYDLQVVSITESLRDLLTHDWLMEHSGAMAGKLGKFTKNILLTVLYFMGMLGAISQYKQYIQYLENDQHVEDAERSRLTGAYRKIQRAIGTYIKVKTFTSFLTGLGYAITCLIFGVDFYLLWGFLAFSLNFIPAVGSVVSTIPPTLMGLIYFDNYGILLIFVLILIGLQVVIGSILDPMLMGSHLSLNLVTVILGIVFWGTLWGTPGMLLSLPLMVLIKIILEQLPDASVLVRLMESKKLKLTP